MNDEDQCWLRQLGAARTLDRAAAAPPRCAVARVSIGPGSRDVWGQLLRDRLTPSFGPASTPLETPGVSARVRTPVTRCSSLSTVKEAGRDFTYLIVVIVGVGITGGLFYVIFRELFSSSSPNKIYGKALEKCRSHPEVISVFGEPVKGYGEATRRGRRQHVSFIEYVKDGLKHMRVKFYIQGSEPGKQGTVHLEVKENPESGEYEFRYIFVELEAYPRRTIIIEDNRS
ncbi:PREDICTED: mitochondrial import inner membrane translocase subunit Tim21 [Miniopterus natalensis]|uniref:mitochondrial import inner membrane translocase subunit Tim21 n=1 Tax=Miniopterus natalensis TaxID=291302 RepID=UPI0007A70617|nr:PREDICTED: mitochondrial import inner membrane translocase subunit Tim21 [Miniopterus natalensis]